MKYDLSKFSNRYVMLLGIVIISTLILEREVFTERQVFNLVMIPVITLGGTLLWGVMDKVFDRAVKKSK